MSETHPDLSALTPESLHGLSGAEFARAASELFERRADAIRENQILRLLQAGELPALHDIADGLLENHEQNHPDREIVLIAAVYLLLGDLLFTTDPEKSDRAAIVASCRELGHFGTWLVKSQPRTMRGARIFVHLAARILEARETGSGLALAQGPAEKFLALALDTLEKHGAVVTSSGHVMIDPL